MGYGGLVVMKATPVNFIGALDGFNQGREIREQRGLRNLQAGLAQQRHQIQAEKHDLNKLKFADEQTKARVAQAADGIGKAALSAPDDATFQAMLPSLAQKYGAEFVKDYAGAGGRKRATFEAQTIQQILSGQRQDRNFDATQSFRNQSLGLRQQSLDIQRQKAAQGPAPTATQRDLMAAGLRPGTPEFAKALRNKAEGRSPGKLAEAEQKVRKEFQALTKTFRDVRDSYTRVLASGTDPSAAGDLALIFNYMKMLDPGSVVRESEFATAQNAAGVPERLRAKWNDLKSGQKLGPTQRADFMSRAKKLMNGRQSQFNKTSKQFEGIAKRGGLDPQNVVIDHNAPDNSALQSARDAISQGADPQAVRQRLQENGIDASGL